MAQGYRALAIVEWDGVEGWPQRPHTNAPQVRTSAWPPRRPTRLRQKRRLISTAAEGGTEFWCVCVVMHVWCVNVLVFELRFADASCDELTDRGKQIALDELFDRIGGKVLSRGCYFGNVCVCVYVCVLNRWIKPWYRTFQS